MNRETWLNQMAETYLIELFKQSGYDVPENIRYSIGFPSRGATAQSKRTIGQCFSDEASSDSVFEIFVSPMIDDASKIVDVLIHEMVHATVGLKAGHKKPFRDCALAVGLTGKMTATTASDELKEKIAVYIDGIGDYPAGSLDIDSQKKKQTTRMIKAECVPCNYIVRLSRTALETVGAPICPGCKTPMETV